MTNSCHLIIQEWSQMALKVQNNQIQVIRQRATFALMPGVIGEKGAGVQEKAEGRVNSIEKKID